MAKILVHRDGAQLGPYEEEEVRQFIYAGRLRGSDLAWREGLPEWIPLAAILTPTAAQPVNAVAPTALPAPSPYPVYGRAYGESSPLAIASLVLGLISLMGCMFVTAIPGVICGHLALAKIRGSQGYVTGEGIAMAGLITGYSTIFITVAAILLVFIIPAAFAIGIPFLEAL